MLRPTLCFLIGFTSLGWTAPQASNPASTPSGASGLPLAVPTQAAVAPGAAWRAARRPRARRAENVLVILVDDLGVDMLASYGLGTDPPPTPHLDALAERGVRFENCWSSPICSPSRALVQTGRYGFRTTIGTGVTAAVQQGALPLSELALPRMLERGTQGRYATAAIGKWHLGNETVGGALAPNVAGYEHFAGTRRNSGDYYVYEKVVDGQPTLTDGTRYATSDTVDDALEWIDSVGDRPWMLYLAFQAGHAPFQAPPDELHTRDLTDAHPKLNPRPIYEAMVEALDAEIGRLFAGLREELQRTTVIFAADNGSPGQATLPPFDPLKAKGTLFEGGVRVPLILAGPHVREPGSTCEALVNLTDLYATTAEVAGVDLGRVLPPDYVLDSKSLLPYARDPERESLRRYNFAEIFFPNGAGLPVPGQPDFVCQVNHGGGSAHPLTPVLEICGPPLAIGNVALIAVSGAPSFSPVTLSTSIFPVAGELTEPIATSLLTTDLLGCAFQELPGGGPVSVFARAETVGPGGELLRSDLVEAVFLPLNVKVLRNERFKLIASINGGPDLLFDLEADPFEEHELLASSPGPRALAAYTELRTELAAMFD